MNTSRLLSVNQGKEYHYSSKASRREDLQVEEPVACRDCASFDFHPTVAGMLRTPLVGHEVVQMGEPAQKRLLAALGMMEALHHAQLPLDGVIDRHPASHTRYEKASPPIHSGRQRRCALGMESI